MAHITEQLMYSTVRLEGMVENGISVGTGFFFQHENHLYLVTNKHVIKGVTQGQFLMKRGRLIGNATEPISGSVSLQFTEAHFVGHPDPNIDVAITDVSGAINYLVSIGTPAHYIAITADFIPDQNALNTTMKHIENITFIGYPNGLWDHVNFAPISRKGITATPYINDFQGTKTFLVDASVFQGSSGSPVFILDIGFYSDKNYNTHVGNRVHFLGVIAQVVHREEEGEFRIRQVPANFNTEPYTVTKQMIDLGIVFKSSTVLDCIKEYKKSHSL